LQRWRVPGRPGALLPKKKAGQCPAFFASILKAYHFTFNEVETAETRSLPKSAV
jgi:hypothetical protein